MTHYGDDTTPDDIRRGDQCALVCPCGSRVILAWANLPEAQRFTPLRDMRAKMVCRRCGHRRPQIVISGHYGTGGQLREFWRWPPASRT